MVEYSLGKVARDNVLNVHALKRPSSDTNPTVGEPSISRRKLEMEDTDTIAPDANTHDQVVAEPGLSETTHDFIDTTLGDRNVLSVPDNRNDDEKDMDKKVLAGTDEDFSAREILVTIIQQSQGMLDPKYRDLINAKKLLGVRPELEPLLKAAWEKGSFGEVRNLPILRPPSTTSEPRPTYWRSDLHAHTVRKLAKAYITQFIGDAAISFVGHLGRIDDQVLTNQKIYAKAVSVVQSSGTGKSRMLTEAGRQIFTLPICVRSPSAPGYPPSDPTVYHYFDSIPKNDLSLSSLWKIACFIAAAHERMLSSLQEIQEREGSARRKVLLSWYSLMEHGGEMGFRQKFFEHVVKRAEELQRTWNTPPSPKRGVDGKPEDEDCDSTTAMLYYGRHAKKATLDLMDFLKNLLPVENPLCVTYFDEAHELGLSFWMLLHLLQAQESSTRMWYVFMSTKSSISYYAPTPENQLSRKLRDEISHLVPPYIALGFDQHAIARCGSFKDFPIQNFETIDHLSQYGRPLWRANVGILEGGALVELAASKLVGNANIVFNARDRNHVFAVVAQRLCLEPVLAGAEAIRLADRSVSHHMQLLTGFSDNYSLFYTQSPSEPLLVLGAASIMYDPTQPKRLAMILAALSEDLCRASLVDKGHLGELCARILLLTARDYAAPVHHSRPNLLKPVPLLDVLHKLLGPAMWAGLNQAQNQAQFKLAFGSSFVNFTHWITTRDPLPEKPTKKLLSNLWSRGAILQCPRNQSSIGFLCVVYFGSVSLDALFDPDKLRGFVFQIKNKIQAATPVERILRPIGIPRDLDQPLPYLTLVMELGNDSSFQDIRSKIKTTVQLVDDWNGAMDELARYRRDEIPTKIGSDKLNTTIKSKRLAMENYNQYSIFVRGASPMVYNILREADIVNEFATLLDITMPRPTPESLISQHMPLERLDEDSPYTAWMSDCT